jgi:hypothetical protein
MRDPMARSRRLTDGTRWRTFMRLLRLDDLMASYTNAGAPELASSWWISTSARLRRADEREIGSGGPVKAVLKR